MPAELKLLSPVEFPPLLREIHDPPKRLYLRGTLPPADHAWLAVVGSRACTEYGRRALRHLIEGLRGYPIVVVSGLAFGIDAEAHRAALEAGLPTVAVPGSGLDWDVLYPRAHAQLARDILASGGALLSEEEPNAKTMQYMFPKRNRIMAGISKATLMIEAREKSGSLITAKFAAEYNRDLLAVPGSIFSEESRGAHQFLRLGAALATSADDILASLGLSKREDGGLFAVRDDLSDDERRICGMLASPISRDELLEALGMPISDANVLLSTMELKGIIVEEFGIVRVR